MLPITECNQVRMLLPYWPLLAQPEKLPPGSGHSSPVVDGTFYKCRNMMQVPFHPQKKPLPWQKLFLHQYLNNTPYTEKFISSKVAQHNFLKGIIACL